VKIVSRESFVIVDLLLDSLGVVILVAA